MTGPARPTQAGPAGDIGRRVAQLFCLLFALIGAAPFAGELLLHSPPIQRWAAEETARVLREELGVRASYGVEMSLWPLRLSVHDVVVPASDGGRPALKTDLINVTPRIFSLLAGRLDIGDIEIEAPRGRLVIRDGAIKNVAYRLPKRTGPAPELTRAPFSSLSVTGAELELDLGDVVIHTGSADIDVFGGERLAFEVAVRAAGTQIRRARPSLAVAKPPAPPLPPSTAYDEDIICRIDLRALLEPSGILVRRLWMLGLADDNPAKNTLPICGNADENHARAVALRLSSLRLVRSETAPLVDGHVMVRAPLGLTNRFVKTLEVRGWAGFSGQIRYDTSSVLPKLRGRIKGGGIGFDIYHLAKELEVEVDVHRDVVTLPEYRMVFADGEVVIKNIVVQPLTAGVPIRAERADGDGMKFQALMRDLGVTPNTIVQWELTKTRITNIRGTIVPLHVDAELTGDTRDFEVFDRAFHHPARRHMIGVKQAAIRTRIGVRPNAFELYDMRARFGNSSLQGNLVSIGFDNQIRLSLPQKSAIDLKDISPLVDIPLAGKAQLTAEMSGISSDPELTGELSVEDFSFGGFPLGTVHRSKVKFRPLKVELADVAATKGRTNYVVSSGRLDFESGASILADFKVSSGAMDVRDFLAMWHFETDPRFEQVSGTTAVTADVHLAMGGPEDRCKTGYLRVDGESKFKRLELFEERYDGGDAAFSFEWHDRRAGHLGFDLDLSSVTLKKGKGTLFGSLQIATGGKVSGHFVGTEVPVSEIDGLGTWSLPLDGRLSGIADVSGTIDELEVLTSVRMSSLGVGTATLPASQISMHLKPERHPAAVIGTTACGNAITAPFDRAEWDADKSLGTFHVSGSLFGKQVTLDDLRITRQRAKRVRGRVELNDLDLRAVAELSPAIALSDHKPSGKLRAKIDIDELLMKNAMMSRARIKLERFTARYQGAALDLEGTPKPLTLETGRLSFPGLALALTTSQGQRGVIDVGGSVSALNKQPQIDAEVTLRPMDLKALASLIPRAQRVSGTLGGRLSIKGTPSSPSYSGQFALKNGEIHMRGLTSPISDIGLTLALDNQEARITRGSAKIGGGSLRLGGGASLRGFALSEARLTLAVRDISLPDGQGAEGTADADLVALYRPNAEAERSLPKLTGNVTLRSVQYARRITMTADIDTLAQRGRRTEFEAYDPDDDAVQLDLTLQSPEPVKIRNNLVEAELVLGPEGLLLSGTNQRFGLRGLVRLKPGGRIRLRRNEFEIREGFVRFDDVTRVAPQVDLTAVTEYKRYSDALAGASTGTSASGGQWLIKMHAYGDAEKLRIDLSSEPALSQDDIFLLLTVGLTRAELDQTRSASVGESVALEALGTLSGADKAVTDAVPVIDEFRFGSAYSSRTGRTEPTVTIGKRLAERIRANVTTGLAESSEVRSNVEWKLSPSVSLEGSYDNVNDISSSALGNLGADIRWRLDFD